MFKDFVGFFMDLLLLEIHLMDLQLFHVISPWFLRHWFWFLFYGNILVFTTSDISGRLIILLSFLHGRMSLIPTWIISQYYLYSFNVGFT